jgi:diguanylate cyclase (GGDEF)-like protein
VGAAFCVKNPGGLPIIDIGAAYQPCLSIREHAGSGRQGRESENVGKGLSRKLDLVFTTFIEATGLITTGASRSRIVTPILACACEILGGKAAFAVLDTDGKMTRVAYSGSRKSRHQAVEQETVELKGQVAKLYKTNKPMLLLADSAEIRALTGTGSTIKRATVIGTSLRYMNSRLGALGVVIPHGKTPEPEDPGLFELLAKQAAVAIRNAREFEKTQTLSITDGLTGAYNYRFLVDALRKEIGIAVRFKDLFSLIMIDVDGLKEYNDVHGHLRGSEVIRQIARLASSKIRAIDMLCKYGGDEFVVLLPRTPKGGAALVAERLRDLIETHRFPGEETTGKITASFGIAAYPEDGRTVEGLIDSADRALYRAKRHGRNLVWLSGRRTPYSPV